jgi:hypothetical protein
MATKDLQIRDKSNGNKNTKLRSSSNYITDNSITKSKIR